jgi:orotidine-5'-phosphate decarboxylase
MVTEGVLVAADLESPEALERLIARTADLSDVVGYKLGILSILAMGLSQAVSLVRARTTKMIIYDHQKGGNDIPDIQKRLVRMVASSDVAGIILFPFTGPVVIEAMVREAQERGITPIVGAHMTHPSFLATNGGYIAEDVPMRIFDYAMELGVTNFVLPGTAPEATAEYARTMCTEIADPTFWIPGIGRQGGSVSRLEALLPSEARVIAIAGSSLYLSEDPQLALATTMMR